MKPSQALSEVARPATTGALSSGSSSPFEKLARTVLLPGESEQAFNDLRTAYIAKFMPLTAGERTRIDIMAVCKWRQIRVWGHFAVAFSLTEPDSTGPAAVSVHAEDIDHLYRAEASYDRMYRNARTRLEARPRFAPAAPPAQ